MTTLTLRANGAAPVGVAWQRYADPGLWSTWAWQIRRVETGMARLERGGTGVVRAGLPHSPTLGVPFEVLVVDEAAMEWSWRVRLGPIVLRLDHGVIAQPTGSSTWLRLHGPLPIVLGYAPAARHSLGRLVAQEP